MERTLLLALLALLGVGLLAAAVWIVRETWRRLAAVHTEVAAVRKIAGALLDNALAEPPPAPEEKPREPRALPAPAPRVVSPARLRREMEKKFAEKARDAATLRTAGESA